MRKTFGPAFVQSEGHPDRISCSTTSTYCLFLHGRFCTDQKPKQPLPDTSNTPDWCRYRSGILSDVAHADELRTMGLSDLNRAALSQILKELPREARECAPGSTTPPTLREMSTRAMLHAVWQAKKRG